MNKSIWGLLGCLGRGLRVGGLGFRGKGLGFRDGGFGFRA